MEHQSGKFLPPQPVAPTKSALPITPSKASPPISPLRGSGTYITSSRANPARWQVWGNIPTVALWQAVCLTLDVEPDTERHGLTRWFDSRHGVPAGLTQDFVDRLQVTQANVSTGGPIRPQELYVGALASPHCPVQLSEVAAFAICLGWPVPDAMRTLAQAPAPQTPTLPARMIGRAEMNPLTVTNNKPSIQGTDVAADDSQERNFLSGNAVGAKRVPPVAGDKPWLIHDQRDLDPEQPWYTPARYFARQLVKEDATLLLKKLRLANKVSQSLNKARIYKRGGKEVPVASTVLKALSNINLA